MADLDLEFNYDLHFPHLSKHKVIDNIDDNNRKATRSRIEELNDTLLELIFTRLLAWQHLATSKCVSRRWNSIISNPDFLRTLDNNFYLTLYLRCVYENDSSLTVTEHPNFRRDKFCPDFLRGDYFCWYDYYDNIVGCYNDLLIMSQTRKDDGVVYYITNPLTEKFIVVPLTWDNIIKCHDVRTISWYAFRSVRWMSIVGFAGVVNGVSSTQFTNPLTTELGFRIAGIIKVDQKIIVLIYSSITGQWKTLASDYVGCGFRYDAFEKAVTYNNKVHWHSKSEILVIDPFEGGDNVEPRLLTLPEEIPYESVLGICQNRLQLAHFKSNHGAADENPRIKVWEFVDYEDLISWKRNNDKAAEMRLVIDFELKHYMLDSVLSTYVDRRSCSRYFQKKGQMICSHPNDANIVYVMYRNALLRCDLLNRRLKVIVRCPPKFIGRWSVRFIFLHPLLTAI